MRRNTEHICSSEVNTDDTSRLEISLRGVFEGSKTNVRE